MSPDPNPDMKPAPTTVPLLLLPGHLCNHVMWADQLPVLQALAPTRVVELGPRTSIAALADDVLAVAPPRFALAGFSLGGFVALEIARREPGRLAGLALLDTSPRPDTEASQDRRRQNIMRARTEGLAGIVAEFVAAVCGPSTLARPALRETVRAMMASHAVEHYCAQQQALASRPDSRPGLAAIAVPTLVACGALDGVTTPEMHAELARGIVGAHYETVADAGHMATMEQPAAVNRLLQDWWARVSPR